jgi:hypothetical protein
MAYIILAKHSGGNNEEDDIVDLNHGKAKIKVNTLCKIKNTATFS